MFQRIQSIYLLLALALSVVVCVNNIHLVTDRAGAIPVVYYFSLLINIVFLLICLPQFKKRRKQMTNIVRGMVWLVIACVTGALVFFDERMTISTTWKTLYVVLPFLSMIFSYLAWRAIAADEKKVRDADRIR